MTAFANLVINIADSYSKRACYIIADNVFVVVIVILGAVTMVVW